MNFCRLSQKVIKTSVQTRQCPSVKVALEESKLEPITNFWKNYPVVLALDVPFQIVNFILYGIFNDYLKSMGVDGSVISRLFCGITCGCIAAYVTCPLDVAKTRIISREKVRHVRLIFMMNSLNSMMRKYHCFWQEQANQRNLQAKDVISIAASPDMAFSNATDISIEVMKADRSVDPITGDGVPDIEANNNGIVSYNQPYTT